MSEILVTGATGFVGPYLISALQARGDRVRALVLPGESADRLGKEVMIFRGDIRSPETMVEAFKGVDTVFNLAATHGLWHPKQEYYDVNVNGTENICRASLAAGVRRLVHMSTWTVCGFGNSKVLREDAPFRPVADTYQRTKIESERVIRRYIDDKKLAANIIRPDTIIGPGDTINFGRMADRLRDGKAVIIGSGQNAIPFAYVTDIVRGTILAASPEAPVGQVYNIGNDQPLTQLEMWNCIAENITAERPHRKVPYWPLFMIALAAETIVGRGNPQRQPLVTRYGVQIFGTDNRRSIEKARRDLGYEPQVSVREGVRLACKWYLDRSATVSD